MTIVSPATKWRGGFGLCISFSIPILLFSYILHKAIESHLSSQIFPITILSILSFFITYALIPRLAPLHHRAGLSGRDLNKKGDKNGLGEKDIPEALGLVCAAVYLVVLCACCLIVENGKDAYGGGGVGDVGLVTAAMASVAFMVLLGFADDVLDLKWRYKLFLPLIASLPLLVNYKGGTDIKIPRPFIELLKTIGVNSINGGILKLGMFYYVYMALLTVFCTNAINIYAGINGLETGQSIIIACFVLLHNVMNLELNPNLDKDNVELLIHRHLFSIFLIMPFLTVTFALFLYNCYPSQCFVGDTFTFFAGITFAVAAILGHYSQTLLLLFLPQIVNFLYSLPQLFGLVDCPRHRLLKFDKDTGLLYPVKNHLTLMNLILMITGPMTEKNLCNLLLAIQVISCALGLGMRYVALTRLL